MKFSQAIILLVATLAVVAFGIASADFFKKDKPVEEPANPCGNLYNKEECNACCEREDKYMKGVIYSHRQHRGNRIELEQGCKCVDKHI